MEIRGAVVVVTGASSGIGAATAKLAHARGAHVVMAARRSHRLQALAAELPGALAVPTDVTAAADLESLITTAVEAQGRVDILVNNAGQGLHVPLEEVELDALRDVLALNLLAPLRAMQLVLPHMRRQGRGAIVNVSSGTTRMTLPGVGAYSATKAALNQLSATARAEWEPYGIVVSLVLPPVTATEFFDSLRQGIRDRSALLARARPATAVAEAVLGAAETGEAEVFVPQH
jgi:short-subunit dehydrogenase